MASGELCTCGMDRRELLERAGKGEGVLALLLPLTAEGAHIQLPVPHNDRETIPDQRPVSPEILAQRFIRLRRKRDAVFEGGLFADPAWDMMLDLYQASQKPNPRPISITSLCIASAVPSTTALRWIDVLIQKGLLARHADERDRRRSFVALTDEAARRMEEVLGFWTELA